MEIQITSTDQITDMEGVKVRVWRGVTARGVDCVVFVHRVAVAPEADPSQFASELEEQLAPGRTVPLSAIT